jgi:putative membrane protein
VTSHVHARDDDAAPRHGRLASRLGLLLFLLWWAMLVFLLMSGRYTEFLNPTLWPLILLGILLAGAFLTALIVLPHGHAVRPDTVWVRTGILALPLLYVFCGFGETLGSDALAQRSIGPLGSLAVLGDMDDDFGSQVREEGHLDIQRIVRGGNTMLGNDVTTVGQVGRDVGEPDGHIVLFRFVVTCCVADAQPVGILVNCGNSPPPPKDAWFEVKGTVEKIRVAGRPALVIRRATLNKTSRPEQPYLYGL